MTITEFAILVFKSPPDYTDVALQTRFQMLSDWQSACSGSPLLFFADQDDRCQIHLLTGWPSVAAHDAWIQGVQNQTLLRLFAPYVDMPKIRMVHLDVDVERVWREGVAEMVVERYHNPEGAAERALSTQFRPERSDRVAWSLVGRDLDQDHEDVFRFVGVASGDPAEFCPENAPAPAERWVLKRVKQY